MRRCLAFALLAGSLVGCSGDAKPTPPGRPASTAKLAIVAPAPGARVPAGKAPVELSLSGARVLPEASTTLTPDTGHVHVRLDGKTLTLLAGLTFDLAELNRAPLAAGQHLLEAEFVAADHGFFNPRVIVTTTFVVG